jgi:hypothetical protein
LQLEADSSEETLKRFRLMFAMRRTEQLLEEHQLGKPAYFDLSGPKLIMQLYTDVPVANAAGRGKGVYVSGEGGQRMGMVLLWARVARVAARCVWVLMMHILAISMTLYPANSH